MSICDEERMGSEGTCKSCGSQVSGYTCNDALVAVRPEAGQFDWWASCDNPNCRNHRGEGYFQIMPDWVQDNVGLPSEMTPAIKHALALPPWQTGPMAHHMRACGMDIKPKFEDEQAHALWFCLRLAIVHGEKWPEEAERMFREMEEQRVAQVRDQGSDPVPGEQRDPAEAGEPAAADAGGDAGGD